MAAWEAIMPKGSRKAGFKSRAQQRFMFAKHPKIAKRMAAETPKSRFKRMPKKKK